MTHSGNKILLHDNKGQSTETCKNINESPCQVKEARQRYSGEDVQPGRMSSVEPEARVLLVR